MLRAAVTMVTLLAACAPAPAPEPADGSSPPVIPDRVVDLSWSYDESTVYWPTDEKGFRLESLAHGYTDAGYFYSANRFSTAEHGGTHLDAPIHFQEQGWSVDEIPASQLVGPGIVVDVSERCAEDPDYQVRREDLEAWEGEHGRIPDGAILLLRTGWGARWGDREAYLGTARVGPEAVAELHFPGLDPEAARWLTAERRPGAVGLDTPSIDHGPSTGFGSHVALFEANVPALENVARLEELPATGFLVVALPMKIAGGSGAPLRAVALW